MPRPAPRRGYSSARAVATAPGRQTTCVRRICVLAIAERGDAAPRLFAFSARLRLELQLRADRRARLTMLAELRPEVRGHLNKWARGQSCPCDKRTCILAAANSALLWQDDPVKCFLRTALGREPDLSLRNVIMGGACGGKFVTSHAWCSLRSSLGPQPPAAVTTAAAAFAAGIAVTNVVFIAAAFVDVKRKAQARHRHRHCSHNCWGAR